MAARSPVAVPFASGLALALLLLSFPAFWPPYVSRLSSVDEIYVHLHTLGVVAWMSLLIAQPLLIRRRRFVLHRRIGRLSYGLAPYVALTSVLLAHDRFQKMDAATFALARQAVYLPLIAVALFITCWALAIASRRRPGPHGRFMTATALPLIDPIVARLLAFYTPVPDDPVVYPLIGYGATDAILLAWLWAERRNLQGRRTLLILLALFLPAHLGWFTLAQTAGWGAFSAWFTALPLP